MTESRYRTCLPLPSCNNFSWLALLSARPLTLSSWSDIWSANCTSTATRSPSEQGSCDPIDSPPRFFWWNPSTSSCDAELSPHLRPPALQFLGALVIASSCSCLTFLSTFRISSWTGGSNTSGRVQVGSPNSLWAGLRPSLYSVLRHSIVHSWSTPGRLCRLDRLLAATWSHCQHLDLLAVVPKGKSCVIWPTAWKKVQLHQSLNAEDASPLTFLLSPCQVNHTVVRVLVRPNLMLTLPILLRSLPLWHSPQLLRPTSTSVFLSIVVLISALLQLPAFCRLATRTKQILPSLFDLQTFSKCPILFQEWYFTFKAEHNADFVWSLEPHLSHLSPGEPLMPTPVALVNLLQFVPTAALVDLVYVGSFSLQSLDASCACA